LKKWHVIAYGVLFFFSSPSCQTPQSSTNTPKQRLLIQTFSLYNQQLQSSSEQPQTWIGDWLFRHKRLSLIQQSLREDQADLIFFQESMEKKDRHYKSDRHILKADALNNYEYQTAITNTFDSTDEVEYALLAYKKSPSFFPKSDSPQLQRLASDGYVVISDAMLNNEPLLLVNVQMPSQRNAQKWFYELKKKIKQGLLAHKICSTRLIVGGYFTEEPNNPYYLKFLRDLKLKDTAQGFCELGTSCNTQDPSQDLAQVALNKRGLNRSDRILVPQGTRVFNSLLNFNTPIPAPTSFQEKYDIAKLYPSIRFGWQSNVTIPTCSNKSLGQ